MRLITVEILDYYDYPLLFIAENDKKHKFLCMLIDETDFLGYLVVKSTTSAIEKMKNNEKDIRSIFEHPEDNHYYYAKMNIFRKEVCFYLRKEMNVLAIFRHS